MDLAYVFFLGANLLFILFRQSSACWHTRETSGGGGDYAPTLLLVGADAAGVALQLPAQLGPLPLYQDDDGYHSVLGPLLCRTTQKNEASTSTNDILAYNIPATLTLPRAKVFCGSSGCFGNRFAPFHIIPVLGIG